MRTSVFVAVLVAVGATGCGGSDTGGSGGAGGGSGSSSSGSTSSSSSGSTSSSSSSSGSTSSSSSSSSASSTSSSSSTSSGGGADFFKADYDGTPTDFTMAFNAYFKGSTGTTAVGAGVSKFNMAESLVLTFHGSGPGTYDCTDPLTFLLFSGHKPSNPSTAAVLLSGSNACSITITEYGAVGGKVAGTFSGSVGTGADTIAFTNGSFSVTRTADQ